MKVGIEKIEYFLPEKIEDNAWLEKENPDWCMDEVVKKTGIYQRHIASQNQTSVDLAFLAAEKIFSSGQKRDEIDFLVLVTQSPDYMLPTSACVLQDKLKLKTDCISFDINLGCSGFVYGLAVCGGLFCLGTIKKGLLICSETYTKFIDPANRTCRPLFGDAAAATLLTLSEKEKLGPFLLGTDGSGFQNLIVPGSGIRIEEEIEKSNKLFMDGAEVFMFTMDMVPKSVESLLAKINMEVNDIDLFIFHQASKLVLDNIARRLDLPEDKVFRNHQNIGNTVSASIPIALKDAESQNLLRRGSKVILTGFGVGYSWGSCFIEW